VSVSAGWALRRRPRAALPLRLLVMAVADRCDQRCTHCQIWKGDGGAVLSRGERLAIVDDALAAGVEEALLTGGEPLLSADLWPIAERLRGGGVRLMLATNGMLLARYAADVGRLFHEVYVSLDGATAASHDRWRGVASFGRMAAGVARLRHLAPSVQVVTRTTLHAGNLDEFEGIVAASRLLGADHASFLPLDASSGAFGGEPEARVPLVPTAEQVEAFEVTVDRMAAAGGFRGGFVLESREKLHRLGRHLRASGGHQPFERPACDAPSWSVVVEAHGALRPCFFHEPIGDARDGIARIRASAGYADVLAGIDSPNQTCARCVCPKKRGGRGLRGSWLRGLAR
jgi:MoaA/NifB/PqqE/SkfB family radical SAM enzyme